MKIAASIHVHSMMPILYKLLDREDMSFLQDQVHIQQAIIINSTLS